MLAKKVNAVMRASSIAERRRVDGAAFLATDV
jgi:hypothetical protein